VAVLAEGLTNTQIAERLFISERTANRHLSNIFTKLGVRNRTAAAKIAIEAGLVG
jgi:DNA-binding NarL/FixJ family response regulator